MTPAAPAGYPVFSSPPALARGIKATGWDGMVVRLHCASRAAARVERVVYAPTWVRHPDYRVLPVGRALRRGQADAADCAPRGGGPSAS